MSTKLNELNTPSLITYEKMTEDLSNIPINESDVLFETFNDLEENESSSSKYENTIYERLEKFILFKSNLELENQNLKSDFSINNLNEKFQSISDRLESIQHFIDVSKKFFSIDKK